MRDLANADWARDAKSPQAKACAKCTKRTDAQAMLFDDMADSGARCLDGECWQRQTAAWKVAHPPQMPHVVGTLEDGNGGDTSADEDDGDVQGHAPQTSQGPTRRQERDYAYVDTIRGQVEGFKADHIDREVLFALAAVFGVRNCQASITSTDKEWAMFDAALDDLKRAGGRAKAALWAGVKSVLLMRIGVCAAYAMAPNDRRISEATRIGALLDLDVEAIRKEIEFDEETK
jgi:hypothetical protein